MSEAAVRPAGRQLPPSISVLEPPSGRTAGAVWRRWGSKRGARARTVARALKAGPRRLCRRLDLVGWHHLQAAESLGRGLVVIAGPFGLWPIAVAAVGWYHGRIMVDARLAGWWSTAVDTMPGFGVHEATGAHDLASMVESGGRVAVDLAPAGPAPSGPAIQLPIAGQDRGVSLRPAQIAVRAGAPLLLVLATAVGDRFRVEVLPPIDGRDKSNAEDRNAEDRSIEGMTARCVEGLALAVAAAPELSLGDV